MPETLFRVRWPDGQVETCYSPSRTIRDFLTAGHAYAMADFLRAARAGLQAASDRVRMQQGFACSRAIAQITSIERRAESFGNRASGDAGAVTVEAFIQQESGPW